MGAESKTFEILLAEDNLEDVVLVEEALKEHRVTCSLHVVRDGAEAIHFLQARDMGGTPRLDLVVVDLHLPKYDGGAVLRHLRSTERHGQTPVILMTGLDSSAAEGTALKHAALV